MTSGRELGMPQAVSESNEICPPSPAEAETVYHLFHDGKLSLSQPSNPEVVASGSKTKGHYSAIPMEKPA